MNIPSQKIQALRKIVRDYYRKNGRDLPWRRTRDPYRILVSEVMLQQTQVDRVRGYYEKFITKFPNFRALERTPLGEILAVWQGLGYNRRALALKKTARIVTEKFCGTLPPSFGELVKLPGIGPAGASAVLAFAFNKPAVFIETNIRSVFIHFFFKSRASIHDKEIFRLVEATLDRRNPRGWYYALMDYGAMLKKKYPNPNAKSDRYRKQSPFRNSNRFVRGAIVRAMSNGRPGLSAQELAAEIQVERQPIAKALKELQREGFIEKRGEKFSIARE
jgi:A/G-specific adenine glycosylase